MKCDTIGVEEMEDDNSFDKDRFVEQVQYEDDEDMEEDSDYDDTDDEFIE